MISERSTTPPSGDRPLLHGIEWAVQTGAADEVMLGVRRRVRRRRQQRMAMLGALGAVVVAVNLWFASHDGPGDRRAAASAVVSVPARQVLPDGTVVELNDDAQITVAYSPHERRVALLRGEAHFEVTHDTTRPFIVAVDSVEVRAVGTAFSVQRRAAHVEVVVTTGRVAVDRVAEAPGVRETPGPHTIAMLDAGNCTLVEVAATPAPPVVEPLSSTEIGERLAWRTPRLEFTRTPLSEAIPMINRHSPIKLSLADNALGEVRISGLLRVDNIDALFRLLETEHGITAERRNAGEVVLRLGH